MTSKERWTMPGKVRRRITARPRAAVRTPAVSVFIPMYNYGHYLEECIDSVLSQPGVDVDVTIVDDASTDDSREIAAKIAERDPRVRLIARNLNRGAAATTNDGLAAITGEYAVKLDADDVLTPGSLARSVALLEAHPSVGFVYGFPVVFTDVPPPAREDVRSWTVWPGAEWVARTCVKGTNCIKQPEVVMRTRALREAGPYNEDLPFTYDFEMWLRLAARWDVGRINGAHQGFYRVHDGSQTQSVYAGVLTDIRERRRAFESFFDDPACPLPDAPALRRIALRGLARESLGYAISAYARGAAGTEPIEEYGQLALAVHPGTRGLREWRALQKRLAAGPAASRQNPVFQARERVRELRFRLRWRRWRWSGVW
jgi:hypothetical protein